MTCPECGQQMWNYGPGQMRCDNNHLFEITALEGVQTKVIRVDLPSRVDRFKDIAIGFCFGWGSFAIGLVLAHYL